MYNDNEFTDNLINIQKLPKNASQNKTKSGKRKPMTSFIADALYDVTFEIKKLQRTASVYYKTSKLGALLTLTNEINNKAVRINFSSDLFDYIKIESYIDGKFVTTLEIPRPKFNGCLFKKLITKGLL